MGRGNAACGGERYLGMGDGSWGMKRDKEGREKREWESKNVKRRGMSGDGKQSKKTANKKRVWRGRKKGCVEGNEGERDREFEGGKEPERGRMTEWGEAEGGLEK